jgi:hypothetical protein
MKKRKDLLAKLLGLLAATHYVSRLKTDGLCRFGAGLPLLLLKSNIREDYAH